MLKKFVNRLTDGIVYYIVEFLLRLFGKLIVKLCMRYNLAFIINMFSEQAATRPIGFRYD